MVHAVLEQAASEHVVQQQDRRVLLDALGSVSRSSNDVRGTPTMNVARTIQVSQSQNVWLQDGWEYVRRLQLWHSQCATERAYPL